jgi:hypothetical protein
MNIKVDINNIWVLIGLVVSIVFVIGYLGYVGLNYWIHYNLPF